MSYGLKVISQSGSTQYDGSVPIFTLAGKKSIALRGGWNPSFWLEGNTNVSFNKAPLITAVHSSEWVSVSTNGKNITLKQAIGGGNGQANIFTFEEENLQKRGEYGLAFFGANGKTSFLDGRSMMKILATTTLSLYASSWSYQAPAGKIIAAMVGGGPFYFLHAGGIDYLHYSAFFRVVNGNKLEVTTLPHTGYKNINRDIQQYTNMSIVVVDVTDIFNESNFG